MDDDNNLWFDEIPPVERNDGSDLDNVLPIPASRYDVAAEPNPDLPIFRGSDLFGKPVPEREWTVAGILPANQPTIFSGHGGAGKGTLMVQLGVAIASGTDWIGHSVKAGPVLGVFAEDERDEIHRRIDSVSTALNIPLSDLGDLHVASLAEIDGVLAQPGQFGDTLNPTPILKAIEDYAIDIGARVVTLDPAADLFGGDENVRRHVRAFLGMLRHLAIRLNGSVLLTVHPSREGIRTGSGFSGSTAWHNSARSLLYLTTPDTEKDEPIDNDRREIRHMKCNLGPLLDPMTLRYQHGVFLPEYGPGGMLAKIEDHVIDRAFLDGLAKLTEQGRHASPSKNASAYGPKIIRGVLDKPLPARRLEAAMNRLLNAGTIRVGPFKTPSRNTVSALILAGLD